MFSVNNFTEFNVKDKGTIINNIDSSSHYETVIGKTIKEMKIYQAVKADTSYI